jgi:hypothetical protein
MSIAGLWLDLCLTKLPQNTKISKFLGDISPCTGVAKNPLKKTDHLIEYTV